MDGCPPKFLFDQFPSCPADRSFFFFLLFFDECLTSGILFSDFTRTTRSGIIGYEGKSIRGMFDEWNIIFRFRYIYIYIYIYIYNWILLALGFGIKEKVCR